MPDKTRPKAAKLTPENIDESAKLKALWDAAKLKLGKRLTQAEFGATYGIGEQGMVWQCLNGRGAAISLNAARGFVRGLREMADMAITIEDFSPRLAAEAAKNSQFAPVASETTTRLPVVRAAEEPHAGYVRLPVLAEAAGGDGCEPLPEVVQYVDVLESYLRQRLHVNPKTIAVLNAHVVPSHRPAPQAAPHQPRLARAFFRLKFGSWGDCGTNH